MRDRTLEKPTWSVSAFHKKVLTSPYCLHLVVEGKAHDGSYYGKIAESSAEIRDRGYQVTKVENLYTGGGKSGILKVYEGMKQESRLVQRTKTARKVTAFMLDRDVENIVGGSRRNPHILYTNGYDVESDILHNGDDALALSTATGLAPTDARSLAQKLGDWRSQAAHEWREWILLCCIAKVLGIQSKASFGRNVVSNDDLASVQACRAHLKTASGLSDAAFDELEERLETKIATAFRVKRTYTLLKGKWLPAYLRRRIEAELGGKDHCDLANFETRVVSNYVASLDCTQPWAQRYRDGWESLLSTS
ncbi:MULTISPECIES: hypothetical protein [unclassified Mycobacterium]|uniref:hypothetical protein n=1 Tax=unclassified Mycobacterium TaxID=2642494 RepID=UPI0029C7C1C3|nr:MULTISPECIES: hypothetical protein [unclassified Mycobacterium]